MPEEGRRESGFTFVELVISMAITALIVPAMFVMLGQLDRLPTRNNAELGASNEVRQAGVWIASDARRALAFDDATDTFTVVGGNVTYQWNPATGDLIRTETGANAMSMAVASNIDAFDLSPGAGSAALVKATLTVTRDAGGVDVSEEATVYGVMRNLSGGFDSVYKTIMSGVGDISITGNGVTIEGNIRAHGDIKVNSGGRITGDAEAAGSISYASGFIDGNVTEFSTGLPPAPAPIPVPGGPYTFFSASGGNLDLDDEAVWLDPGHTQLMPGIYYAPNAHLKLTNADVQGQVTLIGSQVTVQAPDSILTPYYGGVIFWATTGANNKGIKIPSSGGAVWEGILYAPDGEVNISSAFTLYGGVLAKEMSLSVAAGSLRIVLE